MKQTLLDYLDQQRDAVLWKVRGVPERDLRMPMTPTGTNLLGLVKHLAGLEAEYFGLCLGRPMPTPLPWADLAEEPNVDMWATADESPEQIVGFYRTARAWADAGLAELALDSPARVPWWGEPETTVHRLLVHMIAETARHAGHLDILRETVDGDRGLREARLNLPDGDVDWWRNYVERLRMVADASET